MILEHLIRKRAPTALLSVALLLAPLIAPLMTPAVVEAGNFGADVTNAASRSRALAGHWDKNAETTLVDQLDGLADRFHEAVVSGASLSREAKALLDVVESTRQRYTAHIESLQAEVIRIDGDLEAVQDSADWRDRELLAMRLLYRENWIRYEHAVRYERNTTRRKAELRRARDGFAEFAGGGDPALTAESLFGRGLCSKGLADYEAAAADLTAVINSKAAGDMTLGARIALTETQLARGRTTDALGSTAKLMKAGGAGESRRQAVFLRAKALLLATGAKSNASAAQAQAWRSEAAKLLEELYKSGSYWRSKALQLIDAGIENPRAWASDRSSPFVTYLVAESIRRRGDCADAITLYDGLAADGRYVDESVYGIGFCSFHLGNYDRAFTKLSAYLADADEEAAYRSSAFYLRFKATEVLALETTASQQVGLQYREALDGFLSEYPDHKQAFEAWFRLGELKREDGDLAGCAEAFSNVTGDPAFELKSRFLAAQCAGQEVLGASEEETIDPIQVDAALTRIDDFLAGFDDQPAEVLALSESMLAKAAVLGAALAAKKADGGMESRIQRLDRFEERFPNSDGLLSEVYSLRIVAYRSLANLQAAGDQLRALLELPQTGPYEGDNLKKLGIVFLNEGSRQAEQGQADAAALARKTALSIYERLLADQKAGLLDEPVAPLEALIDDLRAQTQP
jgi:hypothetical protein